MVLEQLLRRIPCISALSRPGRTSRHLSTFPITIIATNRSGFRRCAANSLLYRAMHETLYTPGLWMEINYVLEDNWPMVNAIKKLGCIPLRRYRVVEMQI